MYKNYLCRGSAPDPAGELTALPRPPSWWGRGLAALRASAHHLPFLGKNPAGAHGPHILESNFWIWCIFLHHHLSLGPTLAVQDRETMSKAEQQIC